MYSSEIEKLLKRKKIKNPSYILIKWQLYNKFKQFIKYGMPEKFISGVSNFLIVNVINNKKVRLIFSPKIIKKPSSIEMHVYNMLSSIYPYTYSKYIKSDELLDLASPNFYLEAKVLDKKLKFYDIFNPYTSPLGPTVKSNIDVEGNVPRYVEKVYYDEIKAKEAVKYIFIYNKDIEYIQRIFSLGILGIKKRFVSTRQAITAVDKILSEDFKKEILKFDIITRYEVFLGEKFGNFFLIVLLPESYGFELIEFYEPGSIWRLVENTPIWFQDYEIGKKETIPENTGGAYYAIRYSVTKYLYERKVQARIVVFRIVKKDYWAPLGVWVLRDGVYETLTKGKKLVFDNFKDLYNYLKIRIPRVYKLSKLLNFKNKKLEDFI